MPGNLAHARRRQKVRSAFVRKIDRRGPNSVHVLLTQPKRVSVVRCHHYRQAPRALRKIPFQVRRHGRHGRGRRTQGNGCGCAHPRPSRRYDRVCDHTWMIPIIATFRTRLQDEFSCLRALRRPTERARPSTAGRVTSPGPGPPVNGVPCGRPRTFSPPFHPRRPLAPDTAGGVVASSPDDAPGPGETAASPRPPRGRCLLPNRDSAKRSAKSANFAKPSCAASRHRVHSPPRSERGR